MNAIRTAGLTVLLSLVGLIARAAEPAPAAPAPAPPPAIDPKADEWLKKMGDRLASAKTFTFEAHALTEQLLDSGQKVQFARNTTFAVRRPDRAAAKVTGDVEDLQFWYNGKAVSLLNVSGNAIGTVEAPATLDATFDMLAEKYGMVMPMADVLLADPYKTLISQVRSARYLGIGLVFDVKCHHLAFRQAGIDWQVWVEDGANPLPRKLVITYKESPANLQYTAFLNKWNLAAEVADATFEPAPPKDAKRVDFAAPPRAAADAKDAAAAPARAGN